MNKKLSLNPFSGIDGKIFIMSPARPPFKKKISKSFAIFDENNIDYSVSDNLFSHGVLKGFPSRAEDRAAEFNRAVSDPRVKMILCSRGGYASADILPLINWEALRKNNTILMGFSDITALHLAMLKKNAGIPIAGPMLSNIPESFKRNYAGFSLEKALRGSSTKFNISKFCEIRNVKSGRAEGKICAANLTVLCSMLGTNFMPSLVNYILLIEDLNEPFYKVYRYLSQLQLAGVLDEISALLIGDFKNCGSQREKEEVFANFAKIVSGPVLSGIPFGHIKRIMSFRLGTNLLIDGNKILLD